MKLGMWHRLAIVVAVSVSVAVPTYSLFSRSQEKQRTYATTFNACMEQAPYAPTRYGADGAPLMPIKLCAEQARVVAGEPVSWGRLPVGIALMLVFCALAYGLIWLIASVGRWVLRGRSGPASSLGGHD